MHVALSKGDGNPAGESKIGYTAIIPGVKISFAPQSMELAGLRNKQTFETRP